MDRLQLREVRPIATQFTARDDENPTIEGYFAVFNSIYEIAPGMTESVKPGAFSRTLGGDIRALTNHDTTLVLGRTKAHTLELREDEHGLWGKISINPKSSWHLEKRKEAKAINSTFLGKAIPRVHEYLDFWRNRYE